MVTGEWDFYLPLRFKRLNPPPGLRCTTVSTEIISSYIKQDQKFLLVHLEAAYHVQPPDEKNFKEKLRIYRHDVFLYTK